MAGAAECGADGGAEWQAAPLRGIEGGHFVRFEGLVPNPRGVLPGIFVLVNGLAREGLLTVDQERHRRLNNDWYDAAYPNPSHVDPRVYDPAVNPGAVAWFRSSSRELIGRVTGYLRTLDAHGVPYRRVISRDPGRVVYADAHQVVVVPRPPGTGSASSRSSSGV